MAGDPDPRKHFPNIDDKLKAGPVKTASDRDQEQATKKRRRQADEEKAAYADLTDDMRVDADNDDPDSARHADDHDSQLRFAFASMNRRRPQSRAQDVPPLLARSPSPQIEVIRGYGNQDIHGISHPDAGIIPPSASPGASDPLLQSANVVPDLVESGEPLPPRPTLLLTNLPPDFDQGAILSTVFGASLELHQVSRIRVDRPRDSRPFVAAVAVCYPGTPTKVLEDFCRKHNGMYMGRGYYLNISSYYDDAEINYDSPIHFESGQDVTPRPFGAIPVSSCPITIQKALGVPMASDGLPVQNPGPKNAPFHSLPDRNQPVRRIQPQIRTVVIPRPPQAHWRVKLINWTVENIARHGTTFEAMLFNDVEIQMDEKWSFLWNSTSSDGAWFYWRLYETATGYDKTKVPLKSEHPPRFHLPYSGKNMPYWVEPFETSKYYGALTAEELLNHHDFAWGDDDLSDDDEDYESRRRHRAARPQRNNYNDSQRHAADQPQCLGTVQRAKFIWLLKDVPANRSHLANGDVMAITSFALEHATAHGEVVELLIANIIRPFRTRSADALAKVVPDSTNVVLGATADEKDADSDTLMGNQPKTNGGAATNGNDTTQKGSASSQQLDTSSQKLVGLSLITDVLSACALASVRDSWLYRQGFAQGLLNLRVFERLGMLHLDEEWGFGRKGSFERMLMTIIDQWAQRSFFDAAKIRAMRAQLVGPDRDPDERK